MFKLLYFKMMMNYPLENNYGINYAIENVADEDSILSPVGSR